MKQKLAVICALLHKPKVYLLDEHLGVLTPRGRMNSEGGLRRRRGEAVLFWSPTHMLDTAERLCDKIVVIHKGRSVAEGTLHELRRKVDAREDATHKAPAGFTHPAGSLGQKSEPKRMFEIASPFHSNILKLADWGEGVGLPGGEIW